MPPTVNRRPTSPVDPGFAPRDLTDGRGLGEFRSRYTERAAQWGIAIEAVYLAVVLVTVPALLVILYLRVFTFGLASGQYGVVSHYAYAWEGGTLGGALFSIKWLYHSVAHGRWNEDRRLWRLFTPHLSAGLAFAVAVLVDGHALNVFDSRVVGDPRTVIGLGFLVGYFSDSVTGKLADVAGRLFGSSDRATTPAEPKAGVARGVAQDQQGEAAAQPEIPPDRGS